MKQGFVGAVLTGGWFAVAVAGPFYILWHYGIHRFVAVTGTIAFATWLVTRGGVDPGNESMVFLASLPNLEVSIACLIMAKLIQAAGSFNALPAWAMGHGVEEAEE